MLKYCLYPDRQNIFSEFQILVLHVSSTHLKSNLPIELHSMRFINSIHFDLMHYGYCNSNYLKGYDSYLMLCDWAIWLVLWNALAIISLLHPHYVLSFDRKNRQLDIYKQHPHYYKKTWYLVKEFDASVTLLMPKNSIVSVNFFFLFFDCTCQTVTQRSKWK